MKKKEKKIQNAFNREDDIKWLIEQKQNFAKEIITLGQSFEFFQPIFSFIPFFATHISNTGAIPLDQMLFEKQHSSYKLHCFSVLSKFIFPNPTKINYPFEPNTPYFKIKKNGATLNEKVHRVALTSSKLQPTHQNLGTP